MLGFVPHPNAENPEPKSILDADDSQAGQAIYLNFAGAHELLPSRLRVGINGYVLKQITDNRIDGREVSGGRERILGLGPDLAQAVNRPQRQVVDDLLVIIPQEGALPGREVRGQGHGHQQEN